MEIRQSSVSNISAIIIYIYNFTSSGNAYPGPASSSSLGCTGSSEADKQIGLWERRIKGLRRMLLGWDQTRPPDPPQAIQLDVTSSTVVTLRILESVEGPIATKCKGEFVTYNLRKSI